MLRRIEAARLATENMKLRMGFAKQAKKMNKEGTHGTFPAEEKLTATFTNEMILYETLLCFRERERPAAELADLLAVTEDRAAAAIESLKKKKMLHGAARG
jgi:hypothetical protein